MIGGIAETQEMLDFCAEHGIGSEVEVIAADQVNEAYERVLASDVRYRFVIDAATIAAPAQSSMTSRPSARSRARPSSIPCSTSGGCALPVVDLADHPQRLRLR